MRLIDTADSVAHGDNARPMSSPAAAPYDAYRILTTLLVGLVAGGLFTLLHSPLPWMLGPLLVTAAINMSLGGVDWRLGLPVPLRSAGQWAIGTAVGLYFGATVLERLLQIWPWLVIAVLFALLISALAGRLLSRLTGVDAATGFLSMAIGSAVEMSNQAERHGALVDRVAAAQSLRVVLVVVGMPYAFQLWGVHGADAYSTAAFAVDPPRLLLMALATLPAGLLLQWRGIPNAWTLGPLATVAALTASGVGLSAIPPALVGLGQLLMGCSIGARFTPDFVSAAPRFMAAVAVSSFAALLACVASRVYSPGPPASPGRPPFSRAPQAASPK